MACRHVGEYRREWVLVFGAEGGGKRGVIVDDLVPAPQVAVVGEDGSAVEVLLCQRRVFV